MVGDGRSLRVWTSKWLDDQGRGFMRAPFMKNILVNVDLSVNDLIDPSTKSWYRDKLEDLFFPGDIELIVKIKPVTSSSDFLCWKHNKSGDYSVRSGYWLASKLYKADDLLRATALPSLNGIKDLIWSTLAPTKIKVFLWKVVSGAIPVAERLLSRGMTIDSRCQVCGGEGESIDHVLFSCPLARQVWAVSNIPCPEDGFQAHSIYHNLHFVLSMCKCLTVPLEIRRLVPWILWLLWKNRNNLLFEGMVFLVKDMMDKIRESSSEWFMAQQIDREAEKKQESGLNRHNGKWRPPAKPWLKCNVAFSWDKDKKMSGAAWVLRNSRGAVLLHSRRGYADIESKQDAEMESWFWAIESMRSLHIHKVIFAVEGKDLVNAVSRPRAWPSFKYQAGRIHLVLSHLPFWQLVHEERKANLGAFFIAQSVTSEDRSQSYVAQGYPFWLHEVFTNESCVA